MPFRSLLGKFEAAAYEAFVILVDQVELRQASDKDFTLARRGSHLAIWAEATYHELLLLQFLTCGGEVSPAKQLRGEWAVWWWILNGFGD